MNMFEIRREALAVAPVFVPLGAVSTWVYEGVLPWTGAYANEAYRRATEARLNAAVAELLRGVEA
jgi:hypothetical protein